jgi:hypothetical protein
VKRLAIAIGLVIAAVTALIVVRRSGEVRTETWQPVDPS